VATFIVAPTEPAQFKQLAIDTGGAVTLLPEKMGCDAIWRVRENWWGVQRKELKDFIQSVGDGRLAKEIAQMRSYSLPLPLVLIEGRIRWDTEDRLVWNARGQMITRSQFRGMLWSIRDEGVHIDFTSNVSDTVEYVSMYGRWSEKEKHTSIMRRPSPGNYWGTVSNEDYAVHLLQGFDGVGLDRAKAIVQHFGGVPLQWSVSEKELTRVPGIGKVLAKRLYTALEQVLDSPINEE
jgi:ERCC4-type nuclease